MVKMIKSLFFLLVIFTAFTFNACKKDDAEPTESCNTCDTVKANLPVLCAGNNSATYYPLMVGNFWRYANGTDIYDIKAQFSLTLNSNKYYSLQYISSGTVEVLLRTDSLNNIYEYNSSFNTVNDEQLYLPGNPTLNQEWQYITSDGSNGKRVISSFTAALNTEKCEYKNLLEVKEYNEAGVLQQKLYFKKGLGIVQIEKPSVNPFDIYNIILK